MAVGDRVVVAPTSVANTATLDIQPSAGVEWIVSRIIIEVGVVSDGVAAIEVYQGTDSSYTAVKLVDKFVAGGSVGVRYDVTNGVPLRLKNVSGSTLFLGYSGGVTK
jgi:hypothetical protein